MNDSITKLASIAFFGGLIGRGLRYGVNVLIARGLGPEFLGLFAFGMVVMKAVAVISKAGLDIAAQKYIPIYRTQNDNARVVGTIVFCIGFSSILGVVLSLVLYVFRDFIGDISKTGFGPTIQLFILGIPLFSVMMVGIATTKGFKETKYEVYTRDFGQSLVSFVLVGVGAYVFSSFQYVVIGYIISLLIGSSLVLCFLFIKDDVEWYTRPSLEIRKILTFSLPLTLTAVSLYLISWTDILMLGAFVDPTQIGWYQAAYQTTVLLVVVLQAGNSIFPTVAADLYHDGQKEQLDRVYTSVTKWITYLTVLGYVFLVVYADEILSIFGTATPTARTALLVLGLGQVAATITGPVGFLLTMSGHERLQALNAILVCVVNVGLNLVLIRELGIVGAALATGVSFTILNSVRLLEAWYLLGVQPYSRRYWKGALAIGVSVPIMLFGHSLPLPTVVRVLLIGTVSLGVFVFVVRLLGFDSVDRTLVESIK